MTYCPRDHCMFQDRDTLKCHWAGREDRPCPEQAKREAAAILQHEREIAVAKARAEKRAQEHAKLKKIF